MARRHSHFHSQRGKPIENANMAHSFQLIHENTCTVKQLKCQDGTVFTLPMR